MSGLPVVRLNGLHADSLGVYLASLGLFSLVVRKWPDARAVWHKGRFCIVGGPATLGHAVEFVDQVGETNTWTKYEKPWDKAKRADVEESRKGKDKETSRRTTHWRSLEADEQSLPMFGAHLALDVRVRMNPLLGTGGNAGQRKFDRGWRNAVARIQDPPRNQSRVSLRADLESFLEGHACRFLDDFSGGSWFGNANKAYNHGTRRPFRDGEITPWAMALACEGLPYFAGGPSRQLGSRLQPKSAFPFITTAMAPKGEREAGAIEAEVWAPIWSEPMTQPELKSMYLRGRAELDGKGAISSPAFAVAIARRGVDAGISEFRRFVLFHTTSGQTFESRLATVVPVPTANPDSAQTRATRNIVEFLDTLPRDRREGKRWRYAGLRGPLEQALVDFAAARPAGGAPDSAWALLDQVFGALAKVDRNRTFRSQSVRFRLLQGDWVASLFRDDPPDREARLAAGICSLEETPTSTRFIANRIGVRKSKPWSAWEFPESPPARRVWSDATLTENLCATVERRVVEALQRSAPTPPFGAQVRASLDDIHAWLTGDIDEERLRLWVDRLCVIDWGGESNGEAVKALQVSFPYARPVVDGALALYALFRPLASDWLFRQILHESDIRGGNGSTCASLARVLAMLRRGDVDAAVETALAAYRAAGVATADVNVFAGGSNPMRLLAALAIPVRDRDVVGIFRRWRTPSVDKHR